MKVTKVLGRVVPAMDRPRGPDVKLAVCVPGSWICEGATIEIELPRNLACAACEGGGCDACGRAGAVSLRGRKEPPELVEVVLPASSDGSAALLLRLAGRGGLPEADTALPRGNLLITVRSAADPDPFVTRVDERRAAHPAAPPKMQRAVLAALAVCTLLLLLWWFFLSR